MLMGVDEKGFSTSFWLLLYYAVVDDLLFHSSDDQDRSIARTACFLHVITIQLAMQMRNCRGR